MLLHLHIYVQLLLIDLVIWIVQAVELSSEVREA